MRVRHELDLVQEEAEDCVSGVRVGPGLAGWLGQSAKVTRVAEVLDAEKTMGWAHSPTLGLRSSRYLSHSGLMMV